MSTRVLIVDARFYEDIADALYSGAVAELKKAHVDFDRVSVPGAFEIPAVIRYAVEGAQYDGFIALGCVIRGETTHYDYVCGESARGLMTLAVDHGAAIGNGILTVENREQGLERAYVDRKNKGGGAAKACLSLIELKQKLAAKP